MANPAKPSKPDVLIDSGIVLRQESERGCILVGGAMLDELLAYALSNVLVECDEASSLLGIGGRRGALSNFKPRIDLAYALGVLSDDERADLDVIYRLRNRAAHFDRAHGFKLSFNDPQIAEDCRKLLTPPAGFAAAHPDPRGLFMRTVVAIVVRLRTRRLSRVTRWIPNLDDTRGLEYLWIVAPPTAE